MCMMGQISFSTVAAYQCCTLCMQLIGKITNKEPLKGVGDIVTCDCRYNKNAARNMETGYSFVNNIEINFCPCAK